MSVLATVSAGSAVLPLIVGLVIGFLLYRGSETFKGRNNVAPWRMPSLVWGLIGFVLGLLGAILFVIARRTTKPAYSPQLQSTAPAPMAPPPPGWYPDPTSQHEFRFWNGAQWTDRVEDGGLEHVADP